MHPSTIIVAVLAMLQTQVAADTGGCSEFAIQTTHRDCNAGDGQTIYDTNEAICTGDNYDFLYDQSWSATPDLDAKLAGDPYPYPDYFKGTFNCDNSRPTLDFYRVGNGYNVYCAGGDGQVKTYAGDRDDLYDGYSFPCENGYWHWSYIQGFNPCWC